MNLLVNLFVITSLCIIGILIFTSGFLLRRTVVEEASKKCSSSSGTPSLFKSHCHNSGKFSKAVLLIIDALRYDFLTFNGSSEEKLNLPYQNNFNHVNSLLKNQPNNAKLYKFVADPPTTTLQRLKGLTTGSLPTFVDAGSNFDKEEITEDNFIDQLVHNNKSIAFVGDDTWMGLFPNRFSEFHSFPSFNVKDLDMVDNGVIENFDRLIHFTNWTLLIGHMLGVDHCGHTFGPYHIKMKEKLIQMDNFIRSITKNLDNDTILFVMGDHGMTKTGDHGGDSDEEVDAGLFVYSKLPFSHFQNKEHGVETSTISQVDLVPTISLLLGLPIPYQNLGVVIPELFPSEDNDWIDGSKDVSSSTEFQALMLLYANAEQIAGYVEKYLNITGSSPKLQKLLISYEKLKSNSTYFMGGIRNKHHMVDNAKMKKLIKNLLKFMISVRSVLKEQWAKFDTTLMFIGILFIILTVLLNLTFVLHESQSLSNWKASVFVVLTFCFFLVNSSSRYLVGFVLVLYLIGIILWTAYQVFSKFSRFLFDSLSAEQLFCIILWTVYLVSLLSNSFVVYENLTTQFLLQSVIYFQLFYSIHKYLSSQCRNNLQKTTSSIFKKSPVIYSDMKIIWKRPMLYLVLQSFLINVSIFASQSFQSCREEQINCKDLYSFKLVAEDKVALSMIVRNKLVLAFIAIALLTYSVYRWLCKNGSLNGWSPATFIGRYLLFFISILISLHWLLISLSISNVNQKNLFLFYTKIASAICLLVLLSGAALICFPLCLFCVKRSHLKEERDAMNLNVLNNLILTSNSSNNIVPLLYNHLKSQWLNREKDEEEKYNIYLYGLATVYSSPIIILIIILSLLLMMILGFQTAPSVFLLLLIIFLMLNIHSYRSQLAGKSFCGNVPANMIIALLLLASQHFYSVGHHPTISSIKWDSVYYILEGDNNPHLLISLILYFNTFAPHIIVALSLPLFVYWPLTNNVTGSRAGSKKQSEVESGTDATVMNSSGSDGASNDGQVENIKGEYALNDDNEKTRSLFHQLCFKAILFLSLKVLAMMLCVTIHRRHLMVWKIFAPRFIYEIAGFLVFSITVIFDYLFLLRTKRAVDRFVNKITK